MSRFGAVVDSWCRGHALNAPRPAGPIGGGRRPHRRSRCPARCIRIAFTSTIPSFTLKGAPPYTPTAVATSGLQAYEFCGVGTRIVLTTGEVGVGTTLSLTGVGGVNAVIDANKTGRVFNNFGNLTLRDVTVTGGLVSCQIGCEGGGIRVSSGSVVLNGNTAIDGNIGTITGVTATNVTNNTPNNCGGSAVPGCVP